MMVNTQSDFDGRYVLGLIHTKRKWYLKQVNMNKFSAKRKFQDRETHGEIIFIFLVYIAEAMIPSIYETV